MEKRLRKHPPLWLCPLLMVYILIRVLFSFIGAFFDLICEGFEVLGPLFQGIMIGFFGAVALFIFAINLAIWG